jgi:hypothetical protein
MLVAHLGPPYPNPWKVAFKGTVAHDGDREIFEAPVLTQQPRDGIARDRLSLLIHDA